MAGHSLKGSASAPLSAPLPQIFADRLCYVCSALAVGCLRQSGVSGAPCPQKCSTRKGVVASPSM
eukprot:82068-Amphidinium_carterae.1